VADGWAVLYDLSRLLTRLADMVRG